MGKDVKIYALSTCVHCRNAKNLLEELLGIDGFECIYTDRLSGDDRNKIMRDLRDVNPAISFPTTVIDDQCVVGFKEERLRKLLGDE